MNKTNIKTTHYNNNTKSNKNTKNTHKIINWHEYNRALENRGNILLCIDEGLALGKYDKPLHKHTVGHPLEYSDAVIELILTIRALYHLPLRQVVGFVKYWFNLMHVQIKIPSYITLSRRAGKLNIKLLEDNNGYRYSNEGIVLCLDSSGFKIHGEGEWKVRKHGKGKRRVWLETHIGIDAKTRDFISIINTDNGVHDNTQVLSLLIESEKNLRKVESTRPLSCIIGDGAYFANNTYHLAKQFSTELIAPPHKNATMHMNMRKHVLYDVPGWEDYNKSVYGMLRYGLEEWKIRIGYHRRSLVENAFYRMKIIFSDKSNYRTIANQRTEQMIRAKIINKFNLMGLPQYQTM